MKLRIDKYLADMGTGSRSDVKAFIRKGMVKINGTAARTGKEKVDTDCDIVLMNDEPVEYVQYEYYLISYRGQKYSDSCRHDKRSKKRCISGRET